MLRFSILAKEFKTLVGIIRELESDVNLRAQPNGIAVHCLDSAHVTLIDVWINGADLLAYNCSQALVIGLSLDFLQSILGSAANEDIIHAEHVLETTVLKIQIVRTGAISRKTTANLPLLDIEQELLDSNVEYRSRIQMPSTDFRDIVKELLRVGDSAEIRLDFTGIVGFFIENQGDEGYSVVLNPEQSPELSIETNTAAKAAVALSYLEKFSKAAEFKGQVRIYLSGESPVKFEFPIRFGVLVFFIAQKITED